MRKKSVGYVFILTLLFATLFSCGVKKMPILKRSPYLQSAIADSVTVLWRTDKANTARVFYREVGTNFWMKQFGQLRKTADGSLENEVTLKGLKSGFRYEYEVQTNRKKMGDTYSFKAPNTQEDKEFTFFAVGDIGEPIAEEGTPDMLGNSLATVRGRYDFGLLLGDIIYPDGKSSLYDTNLFQYFTEVFPYIPIFPVLGNHDWFDPDQNYVKEWKLPNNEHYYSFDYGGVHFVALDSKKGEMYQYDQQVAWLKEDLKKAAGKYDWTVVFLHHNGNSCTYKKDYEGVVSLYPIFEEYGIDLVLNGHAHTYERLKPMNGNGKPIPAYADQVGIYKNIDGFISITAGSGGKLRGVGNDPDPYTPNPDGCRHPKLTAKAVHDWVYLEITVNNKELVGKAFTTRNRELVDEFRISKE